jgi:two-component system, LuxR family, response regulator DctR
MIHLVDDDADVRDALAWLLRSRRHLCESHASADAFAKAVLNQPADRARVSEPSCVVLDVRMPGTSGLALFERLRTDGLLGLLPVIFLTGHADVPTAVDAVKRGAFDFCEKPFSNNALVDRIEQALAQSAAALAAQTDLSQRHKRLADLTEREREVMALVVDGLPNKLVADRLDISMRTVEVHRARVFDKLGVRSAVELANWLNEMPGGAKSGPKNPS